MRRIGILLMGAPLAAWIYLVGCGSDGGSGLPNGGDPNGNNPDGSGGPGGDFPGNGGRGDGGGGGSNLAACATGESGTARAPIYMDIILDGSQSMDGHGKPTASVPCDGPVTGDGTCYLQGRRETDPEFPSRQTGKKWIAARGALKAYFDSLTPSAKLGVGLYLFSSTIADDKRSIPVASVTAAQRERLYGTIKPETWPDKGTPLLESINDQVPKLVAFDPSGASLERGGKRVILLMTDGVPKPTTPKESEIEQGKVITAVANAYNAPTSITTFVVGIGDPTDDELVYNETFLSKVANVGGAAPQGCKPDWDGANPGTTKSCHYQVTPGTRSADQIKADLAAAIDDVARIVQSCDLPLTLADAKNLDPNRINVLYKPGAGQETQLPKDDTNGWSLDNPPSRVSLRGTACANLKADPKASVRVIIGCKTGDNVIK